MITSITRWCYTFDLKYKKIFTIYYYYVYEKIYDKHIIYIKCFPKVNVFLKLNVFLK